MTRPKYNFVHSALIITKQTSQLNKQMFISNDILLLLTVSLVYIAPLLFNYIIYEYSIISETYIQIYMCNRVPDDMLLCIVKTPLTMSRLSVITHQRTRFVE